MTEAKTSASLGVVFPLASGSDEVEDSNHYIMSHPGNSALLYLFVSKVWIGEIPQPMTQSYTRNVIKFKAISRMFTLKWHLVDHSYRVIPFNHCICSGGKYIYNLPYPRLYGWAIMSYQRWYGSSHYTRSLLSLILMHSQISTSKTIICHLPQINLQWTKT